MTDHETARHQPRPGWNGIEPATTGARTRRWHRLLRDLVIIVAVAVVVSFVTEIFLIRSFYILTGSMQDTLQTNDRIVVNEFVPDVVDIVRGDIVVFSDPGGWPRPARREPRPEQIRRRLCPFGPKISPSRSDCLYSLSNSLVLSDRVARVYIRCMRRPGERARVRADLSRHRSNRSRGRTPCGGTDESVTPHRQPVARRPVLSPGHPAAFTPVLPRILPRMFPQRSSEGCLGVTPSWSDWPEPRLWRSDCSRSNP